MGFSWWHILLVLLVFVLLFGAGRISSFMGDIAKGLKSFNKAMADDENGDEEHPKAKLIENKGAKQLRSRRIASRAQSSQSRKSAS